MNTCSRCGASNIDWKHGCTVADGHDGTNPSVVSRAPASAPTSTESRVRGLLAFFAWVAAVPVLTFLVASGGVREGFGGLAQAIYAAVLPVLAFIVGAVLIVSGRAPRIGLALILSALLSVPACGAGLEAGDRRHAEIGQPSNNALQLKGRGGAAVSLRRRSVVEALFAGESRCWAGVTGC